VKLQFLEKLGIVLVLGLGAMLISPLRYALVGLVKHERFYQHRPASYWLKLLRDDDARYRQWAARTLGDLGPEPGVVPALIEALKDKDAEVHRLAAISLGTIGPAAKQAVSALSEALRNGDDERRQFIHEALAKIDPEAQAKASVMADP
jgi:HEAT repeat protein